MMYVASCNDISSTPATSGSKESGFSCLPLQKPVEVASESVIAELRKCEDQIGLASCKDTSVKTQCTYTLDSPLSPCGLFVNLSTFLATSIDALPLDSLLTAAPPSQERGQQQQQGKLLVRRSGSGQGVTLFPQQRIYLHVKSNVDEEQAVRIERKLAHRRKKAADTGENASAFLSETPAARYSVPGHQPQPSVPARDAAVWKEEAAANADFGGETRKTPTKLAIGVDGGFSVEDDILTGDACPAALTRTFQYSVALLPERLELPVLSPPVVTAAVAGSSAKTALPAPTPLSLYCSTDCCSPTPLQQQRALKEQQQQLLGAQEKWEKDLVKQIKFIMLDSKELPAKVKNGCQALLEHRGVAARSSSANGSAGGAGAAGPWEEKLVISKYAESLIQLEKPPAVGPTGWRCADCGAMKNLWLNLSDGFIGCGRRLYGIGGGCADGSEGASIRHYIATGKKYPLIVKLGTITPYSADVYSYAEDEDCSVVDPLLPQHLSHFGVNIQQLSKTEKSTTELALDWNVQHEWSRATEANMQRRPCRGPGFVGLRNLGNTCYINSVVQLLTSIPEVKQKYVALFPMLLTSLPLGKINSQNNSREGGAAAAAGDLLLQQSSLAVALQTLRYPLQDRRRRNAVLQQAKVSLAAASDPVVSDGSLVAPEREEDADDAADAFKSLSYLEVDSVTPQLYRNLMGCLHAEFATYHQQDAEEFLQYLFQWIYTCEQSLSQRLQEARRRLALFSGAAEKQYIGTATGVLKEAEISSQDMDGLEAAIAAAVGFTAAAAARAEEALQGSSLEQLFTFAVEQRIQCSVTQQVRYSYTKQQVLALPVPMDPAVQEKYEQQQQQQQQAERLQKRHKAAGALGATADAGSSLEKNALKNSGFQSTETAEIADIAADSSTQEEPQKRENENSLPVFGFEECADAFLSPAHLKDYLSSATKKKGDAIKTMKIITFPPFLCVQLKRFFADEQWRAKKLCCPVFVPEEISLSNMRGFGLQEGEVELPEEENSTQQQNNQTGGLAPLEFDPELLAQLTAMGFTENACKRASLAVRSSSPDACVEWIMAHLDSSDLNDPLPSAGVTATPSEAPGNREPCAEAMASIAAMGFSERQARAGLLAVAANSSSSSEACDRALDWLLNQKDLDAAVAQILDQAEASRSCAAQNSDALQQQPEEEDKDATPLQTVKQGLNDGEGEYALHGFITHIGKNANCGHYVCHLKVGDKWVLFNDEKVVEAVNPPVDLGYIYVFKRKGLL